MKILDCTLRDGGYYTSWDFNYKLVEDYIKTMQYLPIDILEVGYRSLPQKEYFGEFFYLPDFALEEIKRLNTKQEIALMLNEKEILPVHLEKILRGLKPFVSLIRLAIDPKNFERAIVLGEAIKKQGFNIAFNLMYMSKYYNDNDFFRKLKQLNGLVSYLNLVDSYGSMYPEQVKELVLIAKANCNENIGFHGHNNLELAFANSMAAVDAGCDIVDSTIMGMGRGAGNLKTELLLTVLSAKDIIKLDFNVLSKIVDEFAKLHKEFGWDTSLPYMVSGANSLPQKDVMEWVGKRFYSYNSIIRALTNQSKGVKDNLELQTFSPNWESLVVLIVGGGPNGSTHVNAVTNFLLKNPDITVIHTSSKNVKAFTNIPNQQIHCLSGNEGYRLESIYNSLSKDKRLAILPPYPRTMGTYVPEFFKNKAFELKEVSFTQQLKDSVTALSIEIALKLCAKEILFIGYDGYQESVSSSEMELFNENKLLFSRLNELDIEIWSLTPTRYSELPIKSIYTLI